MFHPVLEGSNYFIHTMVLHIMVYNGVIYDHFSLLETAQSTLQTNLLCSLKCLWHACDIGNYCSAMPLEKQANKQNTK